MGDGGVGQQVATPENYHASYVPGHAQYRSSREIFLPDLRPHSSNGFLGIFSPPGYIQGAFIMVSGVDFDFIIFCPRAQQLKEKNRHGIRFLSRSTTRAPYAERAAKRPVFKQ